MKTWADHPACTRRLACKDCRTSAPFRQTLVDRGFAAERDFPCPAGYTAENYPSAPTAPPVPSGPGTELKAILAGMGILPGTCSCAAMLARMNAWGPEGCEQHLEEIVTHLVSEANARGWMRFAPFKEMGARGLVWVAIQRARVRPGEAAMPEV